MDPAMRTIAAFITAALIAAAPAYAVSVTNSYNDSLRKLSSIQQRAIMRRAEITSGYSSV